MSGVPRGTYRNIGARAERSKTPEEVDEAVARARQYIEPLAREEVTILTKDLDLLAVDIRRASVLGHKGTESEIRLEYTAKLEELRAILRMLDEPDEGPTPEHVYPCLGGYRASISRKACGQQFRMDGPVRKTAAQAVGDVEAIRKAAHAKARSICKQRKRKDTA